jgi:hypothetical protein
VNLTLLARPLALLASVAACHGMAPSSGPAQSAEHEPVIDPDCEGLALTCVLHGDFDGDGLGDRVTLVREADGCGTGLRACRQGLRFELALGEVLVLGAGQASRLRRDAAEAQAAPRDLELTSVVVLPARQQDGGFYLELGAEHAVVRPPGLAGDALLIDGAVAGILYLDDGGFVLVSR